LDEPSFITKGVNLFDRRASSSHGPKDGFYIELGNMITGAGWISAGPGYRKLLLNENAIVSVSGAVSVRLYRMAQGSIEFPHLAADHVKFGADTLFRDALQVNYFGRGNNSLETNRSGYRLQTNDVTTYAGVGAGALSVQARVGWLQPVTVSSMGREAVYPDTVAVFTERIRQDLQASRRTPRRLVYRSRYARFGRPRHKGWLLPGDVVGLRRSEDREKQLSAV
jgi:hypothetical protein